MKKQNKILMLLFITIQVITNTSCTRYYLTYFQTSDEKINNVKLFHIVDTIQIADPIIIEYRDTRFVTSRSLLDRVKINRHFFKNPDVFFLGEQFYVDVIRDEFYDSEKKKLMIFYADDTERRQIKKINDRIKVYEFVNKPERFILCLANVSYRNQKYSCIDCLDYYVDKIKYDDFFYCKMVYPYRKEPITNLKNK